MNPESNSESIDQKSDANMFDDAASNDSVFAEALDQESPEQIVDMLEQQLADLRDRELKAQAELENFRKRLLRDTEQQLKYALVPFARELLEVVDNLNRATDVASTASGAATGAEGVVAGVKLVQQQLAQVLAKYNCTPIVAVGQPFDPNFHQAIAQQSSTEHAAGVVMFETSIGYMMHDRVIRPSMVIVSTGAPAN